MAKPIQPHRHLGPTDFTYLIHSRFEQCFIAFELSFFGPHQNQINMFSLISCFSLYLPRAYSKRGEYSRISDLQPSNPIYCMGNWAYPTTTTADSAEPRRLICIMIASVNYEPFVNQFITPSKTHLVARYFTICKHKQHSQHFWFILNSSRTSWNL